MVIKRLENDLRAYYKTLLEMNEKTLRTVEELKDILQGFDPRLTTDPTPHKAWFPPMSSIFHGRQDLVDHLASKITNNKGKQRALVSLLGPGGIGKTSIALAVMEHPSVVKHFGNENRFWVPCVKAESVPHFLDTLYHSLHIRRKTGNTWNDILFELEPPPSRPELQPLRVLLLDNFETPWNLRGVRGEVEKILLDLAKVPGLSILMTMRANQPPIDDWESETISEVHPSTSHRIYQDIHPEGAKHPQLPKLLDALGHLPLAITLMAKIAKKTNYTADDLLSSWLRAGTDLLSKGSDASASMNLSIQLSVGSPLMKDNPDALILLANLALFPATIPIASLKYWAPASIDHIGAFSVLCDTALVERREKSLFVLPVIRSYILSPRHLPLDITNAARTNVRQACYSLLAKHKSSPGDPSFVENTRVLASQEANINSILFDATNSDEVDVDPQAIAGLLILCWHHHWVRPRLECIAHTMAVAVRTNNERYTAEALYCYGSMCLKLDRYSDATEKMELAHKKFLALGDTAGAGRCSLKLVEIGAFTFLGRPTRLKLVDRAESEFGQEDAYGIADSLLHRGEIFWQSGQGQDALAVLEKAKKQFELLHKPLSVAHCSFWLSRSFHEGSAEYSAALEMGYQALEAYELYGYEDRVAETLVHLSRVLKDSHVYDKALNTAMQCLEKCTLLGRPIGVSQSLFECGEILCLMRDYKEAQCAFQKSLASFESMGNTNVMGQMGAKRCRQRLSELLYDRAETS